LASWFQAASAPGQGSATECLTAAEKKRLSEEGKVDGRIKVYRDVSERFHQAVIGAVAKRNLDDLPVLVACWRDLLAMSSKDIEANINRKKKSGALINYEIQLRKSIVDMNDARLKAPVEKQEDFDSWLSQAKTVREKFVDILFQR
jgi:hypothetical protein